MILRRRALWMLACWFLARTAEGFSFTSPPTLLQRHDTATQSLCMLPLKLDDNVEELQSEQIDTAKDTSVTKEEDDIPPLPMLDASVILPYLLFIAFWPLLALLRLQLDSLPMPLVDYFDVDKYMALKGMMQESAMNEDIVELPALSPAEQMVGAIFGPPPR